MARTGRGRTRVDPSAGDSTLTRMTCERACVCVCVCNHRNGKAGRRAPTVAGLPYRHVCRTQQQNINSQYVTPRIPAGRAWQFQLASQHHQSRQQQQETAAVAHLLCVEERFDRKAQDLNAHIHPHQVAHQDLEGSTQREKKRKHRKRTGGGDGGWGGAIEPEKKLARLCILDFYRTGMYK